MNLWKWLRRNRQLQTEREAWKRWCEEAEARSTSAVVYIDEILRVNPRPYGHPSGVHGFALEKVRFLLANAPSLHGSIVDPQP